MTKFQDDSISFSMQDEESRMMDEATTIGLKLSNEKFNLN